MSSGSLLAATAGGPPSGTTRGRRLASAGASRPVSGSSKSDPCATALRRHFTAVFGVAHADTATFIPVNTPQVQISRILPNGAYASGSIFDTAAFRCTASTCVEELIADMNAGGGINDSGMLAGFVPVMGDSNNGGDDLGACAQVGASPPPLSACRIAPVRFGNAFEHACTGNAVAFVWTTTAAMAWVPTCDSTIAVDSGGMPW